MMSTWQHSNSQRPLLATQAGKNLRTETYRSEMQHFRFWQLLAQAFLWARLGRSGGIGKPWVFKVFSCCNIFPGPRLSLACQAGSLDFRNKSRTPSSSSSSSYSSRCAFRFAGSILSYVLPRVLRSGAP